ncbi:uncharacterized protein YlbG (UPF0298 family) [Lactobacillus colini]|uniref:Uncharacterized protein YlbG (UPF0298 family) n=1 Tax=Lactobacillus colini TaxID=1819254 RepID=A0ABS4MEK3_9LACO|nr:YlbG family protein [Lactobacillus colini]MBP2057781.1 uncharacterized protein YlbG (UPF0298 family) [Lactobacillus colini]
MGLVFQESENNSLQKRKSIVVWIDKASNQYKLRHYGNIIYFSRKKNYVIMYCNAEQADKVIQDLNHSDFVKKAEFSSYGKLNFNPIHEEELIHELKEAAEKEIEERGEIRF